MVRRASAVAALLVAAATLFAWRPADAACTLKVGWEPYVPYQYAGADGEVTGADIALMAAVAEDIGCAADFMELPWARQLLQLEEGTLDVAMSASWTPERAAYVHFSIPYRQGEMAIFVRRGTAGGYALADLADIPAIGFRLGVIHGYYYGEDYKALSKQDAFRGQVDAAADYATNIQKLLHGRIDGLLVDDVAVMRAEAKAVGAGEAVERHPLQIPGDEFHMMFSKKSVDPAVVGRVDETLVRMRADGRLEGLMAPFLE